MPGIYKYMYIFFFSSNVVTLMQNFVDIMRILTFFRSLMVMGYPLALKLAERKKNLYIVSCCVKISCPNFYEEYIRETKVTFFFKPNFALISKISYNVEETKIWKERDKIYEHYENYEPLYFFFFFFKKMTAAKYFRSPCCSRKLIKRWME